MSEIEFRQVEKTFPDGTHAVKEFFLTVPEGEFMVFVGPSGCGKSTLLRMLAGLEEISAGQILIGGESVTGYNSLLPPGMDRRRPSCRHRYLRFEMRVG